MGQREQQLINQLSTTSHRKPRLTAQPHISCSGEALGCPTLDSTSNHSKTAVLEGYSFAKTGFSRKADGHGSSQCQGKAAFRLLVSAEESQSQREKGSITLRDLCLLLGR